MLCSSKCWTPGLLKCIKRILYVFHKSLNAPSQLMQDKFIFTRIDFVSVYTAFQHWVISCVNCSVLQRQLSTHFLTFIMPFSSAKVFVHCAVGVSRSAALVLAYLMIYHNYTLVDAILKVKEKRWIFPNRGFLNHLINLDSELKSKSQSDYPVHGEN